MQGNLGWYSGSLITQNSTKVGNTTSSSCWSFQKFHSSLLRAQDFLPVNMVMLIQQLPKNAVLQTPSSLPENRSEAISMIYPGLNPTQEFAKPSFIVENSSLKRQKWKLLPKGNDEPTHLSPGWLTLEGEWFKGRI